MTENPEPVRLLFEAFIDGDEPEWQGTAASQRDGDEYTDDALTQQWYAFQAGYDAGCSR